jgi:hypothetical protein
LPAQAPASWTNAFTGETLTATGGRKKKRLLLGDVFSQLPFALLSAKPPNT